MNNNDNNLFGGSDKNLMVSSFQTTGTWYMELTLILTKLHPCNTASTIPATNEAQFRLPVQGQNDKLNKN